MDTTRFYPSSVLEKPCPNWSASQYFQMAERLTEKCIHHYRRSVRVQRAGTLYVGALGPLVYLRFRMAKHLLDSDKEKAEGLLRDALRFAENAIRQEEQYLVDRRKPDRVSLLEGSWLGAKALQCAILYHLEKRKESDNHVRQLLVFLRKACRELPPAECEVLYGRSGALQAILFLRQELQDKEIGKTFAVMLATDIMRAGLACSQMTRSPLPLLWEWHGEAYLGAAHGVVGTLQTLLSLQPEELSVLSKNVNANARDLIRQTIDSLDDFCFASGNLQSTIGSNRDKLVHWCHGATGHVLLLTKASTVYCNPAYLERAKAIGTNVLMQRGLLRKGVGLCHGISGNAYALLSIGRATGDSLWIQRATSFAHFALDHFYELETIPDRPYSLFEGCAGLAVLLLDLCNPEQSAFPLYEFV